MFVGVGSFAGNAGREAGSIKGAISGWVTDSLGVLLPSHCLLVTSYVQIYIQNVIHAHFTF